MAPSAAHIWGAPGGCRAYPRLVENLPEQETDETREGTAAHDIAEHMIRALIHAEPVADFVGTTANNGVLVDAEMQQGAELYARIAADLCRSAGVFTEGEFMGIEALVAMPHVHVANWGTCDFWLFDRKEWTLHIIDFKYGHGVVEAYENWQLLDYCEGIRTGLRLDPIQEQNVKLVLHVVQPRAWHRNGSHRKWELKLSDTRAYMNILTASAAECTGENPVARVGKYCKHCPARTSCDAFRDAVYDAMAYSQTSSTRGPLDSGALGFELLLVERALRVLEGMRNGLAEEAAHRIGQGEVVPGRTAEVIYGRPAWCKPAEEVLALGQMFGEDLRSKKPVTPAEAKKTGVPAEVLQNYIKTRTKGLRAVEDTGTAQRIFRNV